MLVFCWCYGVNLLEWFELFNFFDLKYVLGLKQVIVVQLLEKIFMDYWQLRLGDKDMLVMVYCFEYEKGGKCFFWELLMVNIGEDQVYIFMFNIVGLLMVICVWMILIGKLEDKGVLVFMKKQVYQLIFDELEIFGIIFYEREKVLQILQEKLVIGGNSCYYFYDQVYFW